MRRPSSFACSLTLVGLVVTACGGSVTKNGESGAGNAANVAVDCPKVDYCALRCSGQTTPLYPPSCDIPTCSCVPVAKRNDWAGTYYLPEQPDAMNLVLEQDGTFRWTIDGCDFSGGDCGEWKKSQPHTIVLLPTASKFLWSSGGGTSEVSSLNVVGDPDGDLVVGIPSPGEKPTAQRWKKGRVCPVCSGGGPIKQQQCSDPVPARCRMP